MGLDLYVMAKNRENGDELELCYARKFWGLWDFLGDCPMVNPEDKYTRRLTSEAWERLINVIEPKWYVIRAALTAYDLYYYQDAILTSEQIQDIENYEDWYDEVFDYYPVLGYNFDINALINWYAARDKVRKYLVNDNYDVIIICSF